MVYCDDKRREGFRKYMVNMGVWRSLAGINRCKCFCKAFTHPVWVITENT